MIYTAKFKADVYKAYAQFDEVLRLLNHIDKGDHHRVRLIMETGIDRLKGTFSRILHGMPDMLDHNNRVEELVAREAIYSEFMEMYVEHLDSLKLVKKDGILRGQD